MKSIKSLYSLYAMSFLIVFFLISSVNAQTSLFTGRYKGKWTSRPINGASFKDGKAEKTGNWDISITVSGEVSGSEYNDDNGITENFTGAIDNEGDIKVYLKGKTDTSVIEGRLRQKGNSLSGTLEQLCERGLACLVIEITLNSISTNANQGTIKSNTVNAPQATNSKKENIIDLLKIGNLADKSFEEGKYFKAIENYTILIYLDSDTDNSLLKRGNAKFNLKYYQEAIEDYNEVILRYIAWEAKSNGINLIFPEIGPQVFFKRGLARNILGDKFSACEDFQKSCKLGNKQACEKVKQTCK